MQPVHAFVFSPPKILYIYPGAPSLSCCLLPRSFLFIKLFILVSGKAASPSLTSCFLFITLHSPVLLQACDPVFSSFSRPSNRPNSSPTPHRPSASPTAARVVCLVPQTVLYSISLLLLFSGRRLFLALVFREHCVSQRLGFSRALLSSRLGW